MDFCLVGWLGLPFTQWYNRVCFNMKAMWLACPLACSGALMKQPLQALYPTGPEAFSPLQTLRSPSCPSIGYSSPLSSSLCASLLAVFLEILFSFHPSSSSHLPSLSQRLARGLSSCFLALSLPRSRLPRPRPGRKAITCCGNGWEGGMGVDVRHLRMCCQP